MDSEIKQMCQQKITTVVLGYDVVEAESGRVVITLDPTGAHLNPWGTVHGGLTATLLDSCMGLAINRRSKKALAVQRLSSRFRSSEPSR
jgi:acyl-coenzyme A thioesterase PaaI-like protein